MISNQVKILLTLALLAVVGAAFSCDSGSGRNSGKKSRPDGTVRRVPSHTSDPVGNAKSPTEAYRMLFAAVKSQNSDKIKLMLSSDTLNGLAAAAAQQQRKTVEEVIENGFTATTYADDYPQTRDERVRDGNAAVEVWNERDKRWEDLPFVMEDGVWKLGVGDAFSGKWKSPGKGTAQLEAENANANGNSVITVAPDLNKNFRTTRPKNTK